MASNGTKTITPRTTEFSPLERASLTQYRTSRPVVLVVRKKKRKGKGGKAA